MSRVTIFAALLVVPPDLIAPAALSPIFRKDSNPLEVPPLKVALPSSNVREVGSSTRSVLERSASQFQRPMIESEPRQVNQILTG